MPPATETLASHSSPDGQLTLVVERYQEADGPTIVVGFREGNGWHFHPTEDEALRIVEAVLTDQVVIVQWKGPANWDIELMGDLEFELDGTPHDIQYQFRLWSGPVTFEDLVDGKVPYTPLDDLRDWRA
jgi:hypothetical protein